MPSRPSPLSHSTRGAFCVRTRSPFGATLAPVGTAEPPWRSRRPAQGGTAGGLVYPGALSRRSPKGEAGSLLRSRVRSRPLSALLAPARKDFVAGKMKNIIRRGRQDPSDRGLEKICCPNRFPLDGDLLIYGRLRNRARLSPISPLIALARAPSLSSYPYRQALLLWSL